MKTVLIAGGSGIVGSAAIERFLARDDFDVIAVSRRRPEVDTDRPFRHVAVDLRDEQASAGVFSAMGEVTHVVYAALHEKPGLVRGWKERDQMETNLSMIRNTFEPLTAAADLEHVSLLQGTKAYGVHLHPIPIPAREHAPRDDHENFYWLQEDYLREKAAATGLRWTAWRPQIITGGAIGVAMNVVPVIGVYAALCRHEGIPFAYPGGPSFICEATDADLLGGAFVWATQAPEAADEHFNITNGDVFEWRNLWPALAADLGVEIGPDQPSRLATWLPERATDWDEIVAQQGLRRLALADVLGESHHYIDFNFAYGARTAPPPALVSTIKLRQAGFQEFLDTAESFHRWFEVLRRRRILPPA